MRPLKVWKSVHKQGKQNHEKQTESSNYRVKLIMSPLPLPV
jgi:hypothetical protein